VDEVVSVGVLFQPVADVCHLSTGNDCVACQQLHTVFGLAFPRRSRPRNQSL